MIKIRKYNFKIRKYNFKKRKHLLGGANISNKSQYPNYFLLSIKHKLIGIDNYLDLINFRLVTDHIILVKSYEILSKIMNFIHPDPDHHVLNPIRNYSMDNLVPALEDVLNTIFSIYPKKMERIFITNIILINSALNHHNNYDISDNEYLQDIYVSATHLKNIMIFILEEYE